MQARVAKMDRLFLGNMILYRAESLFMAHRALTQLQRQE